MISSAYIYIYLLYNKSKKTYNVSFKILLNVSCFKKNYNNTTVYIYISNHNFHKLIISPPSPAAQPRSGKFSCAWAPRDSLRASAAYIS